MQQFSFPYELSLKAQLPQQAQEIVAAAEDAADMASVREMYGRSGAALQLTDGTIWSSANKVSDDGSLAICAERVILDMHDLSVDAKIKAIAIACKGGTGNHQMLIPCGNCRQAILEAQMQQGTAITVYIISPDGEVLMVEDAGYLLPFYSSSGYL